MSDTTKRLLLAAIALVALGLFLLGGLLWLGGSLGCEDAETRAFDTVRCDDERGAWWVRLQALLFLGSALGCLVGVVWGMAKPSLRPPSVALAVALPAVVATVAIQGVRVGDKTEPRLANVRAGSCAAPCREGIPVTFTLDRAAEVDFHLGPARSSRTSAGASTAQAPPGSPSGWRPGGTPRA